MLHAVSYSATFDLCKLVCGTRWSLLSRHRHACNLLADDDILVALVSETHGNGPFHIVIPGARFDALPARPAIEWAATRLIVGHCTIDLRSIARWDPQLPQLHHFETLIHLAPLFPQMQKHSPLYNGLPALTARAQQGIECLQWGTAHRNQQSIAEGALLLAGLGPGLTPAGDDFLLGFLAALSAIPQSQPGNEIRRLVVNSAVPLTTQLSAAWLHHAGLGHFGELWHRLINTLNVGEPEQIAQSAFHIAQVGGSSGADALCGFFTCIELMHPSRHSLLP
ncbi:MAG: DUF2877 domain-containing protein [Caldilineaceae bacterium]|nr:DUF2877 domain-containing protein [Caldilineaceae bacterium]